LLARNVAYTLASQQSPHRHLQRREAPYTTTPQPAAAKSSLVVAHYSTEGVYNFAFFSAVLTSATFIDGVTKWLLSAITALDSSKVRAKQRKSNSAKGA
jgi:hypothetical protein